MEINNDYLLNVELESGLNELLDTCMNYIENVLVQEEIMDENGIIL